MHSKEAKQFLKFLKEKYPLNNITLTTVYSDTEWIKSFTSKTKQVSGSCSLKNTKATIRIACCRNLYSVLKAVAHEYKHVLQKDTHQSNLGSFNINTLETEAISFARSESQTYLQLQNIDWRTLVR